MIDDVRSTKLPNGITVLSEHMPGLRSVTAGIWVRRGSRHETAKLNGICHFIEHAVFKGTQSRTARDIAIESDRLGGHLDAFTTHEMTGFAVKVADQSLPEAFDLLADLLSNPRFEPEDLEREQKVILEEMKMVEDTPDEFLGELFNAAYFPNHPLGRPIEGTRETVSSFDRETIAAFHAREFSSANLVVAAAGNVEHERLVDLVARSLNGSAREESGTSAAQTKPPAPAAPILIEQKKELEQAHLVIAAPWPDAKSNERYAASLLSSVMGGGTSSRLWQTIREERGLAYSVGAGGSTFSDVGVFTIYAGTSPEHLDEVVDLALEELRRVVSKAFLLTSSSWQKTRPSRRYCWAWNLRARVSAHLRDRKSFTAAAFLPKRSLRRSKQSISMIFRRSPNVSLPANRLPWEHSEISTGLRSTAHGYESEKL